MGKLGDEDRQIENQLGDVWTKLDSLEAEAIRANDLLESALAAVCKHCLRSKLSPAHQEIVPAVAGSHKAFHQDHEFTPIFQKT